MLIADERNRRLLLVDPYGRIRWQFPSPGALGRGQRFGHPDDAFISPDGRHYLITEILGDWMDEMSLGGHVYWSTHPPGVSYPSDANEVSPGRYLITDYSSPGQVVIFSRTGQLVWRFRPTGAAALNHPSLALPLPNGNILVNDDYNDRVIVISRQTNRIIWQYGHDGIPGSAPGYLSNPDRVDLAPRDSLLMTHAATMGRP